MDCKSETAIALPIALSITTDVVLFVCNVTLNRCVPVEILLLMEVRRMCIYSQVVLENNNFSFAHLTYHLTFVLVYFVLSLTSVLLLLSV